MSAGGLTPSLNTLTELARATAGLEVLLLFGSRGRGDAHARSDWDIGYIAPADFDASDLLAAVVEIVGSDRVDLVNLSTASGVLRHQAARDGQVLFEARPRLAEQFRLDASQFWCDAAPVLSREYDKLLEELPR